MDNPTQIDMARFHKLFQQSVEREVARGVEERKAFGRQIKALAKDYPAIAAAYTKWLLAK